MNRFSVISNPEVSPLPPVAAPRRVETGRALELLTDRQFHVCGDNLSSGLPFVDEYAGGVFVSGAHATSRVRTLRSQYSTVPLIVEPSSLGHAHASPGIPFVLPEPNLFGEATLESVLDEQIAAGSDLAMTPTGQIAAGDSDSLKAALKQANALDREDTLLALPLAAGWLNDEIGRRQLAKVIDRSRHPVALALISSSNPLASRRRLEAYRRLVHETTGTVLAYRVDLAGFDALAEGAIASAIGAYPAARRLTPVGRGGSSSDPEDKSPHMLIGDMLRFVRSKHMRQSWFAEAPSIQCFCLVCRGNNIDRLYGSDLDREIGHQHNVLEIGRLYASLKNQPKTDVRAAWLSQVAGALDVYPQLASHINADMPLPVDISVWSNPVS